MITHYYRETDESELETLLDSKQNVWTHVVAPTEADLQNLVSLYGLDDAIIEDVKDFFEVPRFEQEEGISYFFTRYPYDVKDFDIDTAPLLIVLGKTFLITIAEREVPFLNKFISGKRTFSTIQNTKLFLEFLDELMGTYEKKLTRTRRMVYRDMGKVRTIGANEIQRLVFFEQELNETIAALVPTNTWLQQLTKGNYLRLFSEDMELLEDLLIGYNQLVDSSKAILKTIQNIRGASEAILTQNLNNTIRTLTALTIVLTIPTLVSSLFGMNVPIPFQNNPYAFWFVLALIITAVAGTIQLLRNRWL
jgi:magnesium transporter